MKEWVTSHTGIVAGVMLALVVYLIYLEKFVKK